MSKMKLKSRFVEYMAVGLMTVLIDMPYDIIGIKYVHWVWHDTDPNICEWPALTPFNRNLLADCANRTAMKMLIFLPAR